MDEYGISKLDITRDEIDQLTSAFKNKEFKKLFAEYCEEISDPKNKKLYEEELTQLEAERGIDITFIHPQPGFVIKSVANGTKKAFINVAQCDKVQKPSSSSGMNSNGQPGLNWSLPYSQAPPRNDLDKKGELCAVYDVVFHPDTLYLAGKNDKFKQLVIETAFEAVQNTYNVQLDLVNVRYPKIAYKGQPRPTVIRKKADNPPPYEPSPIDHIYPPVNENITPSPVQPPKLSIKNPTKTSTKLTESLYAIPKFQITHRHNVEYYEMTEELDSKINMTIPKELIVTIHLPLLDSTNLVTLDVTSNKIYLVSDTPAKYKLDLELPYEVQEADGIARFDKTARKLIITLPVTQQNRLNLIDINNCREDSGVESDHDSPKQKKFVMETDDENHKTNVPDLENSDFIINIDSSSSKPPELSPSSSSAEFSSFLDQQITYNFPSFNCHLIDGAVIVTLQSRNVDSKTLAIDFLNDANLVHIKFASLGSGFFPIYYAFAIQFVDESVEILNTDTEVWDNNVILQININTNDISKFLAGLNPDDLMEYNIENKIEQSMENFNCVKNQTIEIIQKSNEFDEPVENNTQITNTENNETSELKKNKKKINKKKARKMRSFSESNCDDFLKKPHIIPEYRKSSVPEPINKVIVNQLKSRSLSESSNDDMSMMPKIREIKSILKRRSSYNRSISESSLDEQQQQQYHGSIDLSVAGSIPEECGQELSESVKKTVRFDNKIRKQLYKIRSSIVGQRKPQANKQRKKKKRSQERQNSEGESSDSEVSLKSTADDTSEYNSSGKNDDINNTNTITDACQLIKSMKIDKALPVLKSNHQIDNKTLLHDLNFKSDMIFDIEM